MINKKDNDGFDHLLNVKELAYYLNVSEALIRKLIRTTDIPFTRVNGRSIRFNMNEIKDWLSEDKETNEVLSFKNKKDML